MKTKLLLFIAVIVLLTGGQAHAVPDKTFTSSGQILPGEEWDEVFIYGDDTVVNMLGGTVLDYIATYDASNLNVTGGDVKGIYAFDNSVATVSGGELWGIHALDYATVNFSGNSETPHLRAGNSGTLNMLSGTVRSVGVGGTSITNLYSGNITDWLGAGDFSTVNIYGYDFTYDPMGGDLDGGQLTGFWLDSTPFTIDLYGVETYSHINLIPEPGSLILFLIGSLFLRRRR